VNPVFRLMIDSILSFRQPSLLGGQRRNDRGQGATKTRHQVDSTYGILRDATPDRILEGFVEEEIRVGFVSIQHQVEVGGSCQTAITFLPVPQSGSPEAPKFRGARRDLEPVVANEEEIVRAFP